MKDILKRLVSSNTIDDVYLSGFVDIENGTAEFYPDMRYLYFLLGDKYIEFQSVEQSSRMKIMITDSVMHKFEIDEEMMPAKASVNETILVDTLADNSVKEMFLYNIMSISETFIVCDAVQMNLNSGQQIFLDPTFYYGVGIGGVEQKEWWKNNLSNGLPSHEDIINK